MHDDDRLGFPEACSRLCFPKTPDRRWRDGTVRYPPNSRFEEPVETGLTAMSGRRQPIDSVARGASPRGAAAEQAGLDAMPWRFAVWRPIS